MAIDIKKRLWTLAVTTAFVVTACTQRATAITIHTIGDSMQDAKRVAEGIAKSVDAVRLLAEI